MVPIGGIDLSDYQSFELSARLIDTNGFLRNALRRTFSRVANISTPTVTEPLTNVTSPTSSEIGTTYFSVETNNDTSNDIIDGQEPTSSTYYLRISTSDTVDSNDLLVGSSHVTKVLSSSDLNTVLLIDASYISTSSTWSGSQFTLIQGNTYYCQIYRSFSGGWSTHYTDSVSDHISQTLLTPPTLSAEFEMDHGFVNPNAWEINFRNLTLNYNAASISYRSQFDITLYFQYRAGRSTSFQSDVEAEVESNFVDVTRTPPAGYTSGEWWWSNVQKAYIRGGQMATVLGATEYTDHESAMAKIGRITFTDFRDRLRGNVGPDSYAYQFEFNRIYYSEAPGQTSEKSQGENLYWHAILKVTLTEYGYSTSYFGTQLTFKARAEIGSKILFKHPISSTIYKYGNSIALTLNEGTTNRADLAASQSEYPWIQRFSKGNVIASRDIRSLHIAITSDTDYLRPEAFFFDTTDDTIKVNTNNGYSASLMSFSGDISTINANQAVFFTTSLSSTTHYAFFIIVFNTPTGNRRAKNETVNTNTVPHYSDNLLLSIGNLVSDYDTPTSEFQVSEYTMSAKTWPSVTLHTARVVTSHNHIEISVSTTDTGTDAVTFTNSNDTDLGDEWDIIIFEEASGLFTTVTKTIAEITANNVVTFSSLSSDTYYRITVEIQYTHRPKYKVTASNTRTIKTT